METVLFFFFFVWSPDIFTQKLLMKFTTDWIIYKPKHTHRERERKKNKKKGMKQARKKGSKKRDTSEVRNA